MNSLAGVYPLFRCNAADLAGAAVRVHIALSSTSAALTSRLHCAEEYSSGEDESTEKAPDPSQQVPENHCQNLDMVNSEISSEKPQEGDVEFLENTVAVNILVERAMHLSLKGKPPPAAFLLLLALFVFNFYMCLYVFLFVSWVLLITGTARSNFQTKSPGIFFHLTPGVNKCSGF